MLSGSDHVLRLRHRVPDLDAAVGWLAQLGFEERERTAAGTTVDNGALALRLEPGTPPAPLQLEIASTDLVATAAALCAVPGVVPLGPPVEPDATRIEQRFSAPYGFELVVVRQRDLDEQGVRLPVPATLPWEPAALELLGDVLRFVPLEFRRGALARAAAWAEARTLALGALEVSVAEARSSLLATTPDFQRERLVAELTRRGLGTGEAP